MANSCGAVQNALQVGLDQFQIGTQPCNVGEAERVVSLITGAGLLGWGLRSGSVGGLLLGGVGAGLLYRGLSGHCGFYQALGTSTCQSHDNAEGVPAQQGLKLERTISIQRAPKALFDQWRNFENLARIMPNIESVRDLGGGRSHWTAIGPLGVRLQWDAVIHNEEPGRLIAWKSLPGGQVDMAGSVHFDEGVSGQETNLRLSLKYNPPGGVLGAELAWLMGAGAEQRIEESLQAFKKKMEAERTCSQEQPHKAPAVHV